MTFKFKWIWNYFVFIWISWMNWHIFSVTRLGNFWKVAVINFLTKVSQTSGDFFGYFVQWDYSSKHYLLWPLSVKIRLLFSIASSGHTACHLKNIFIFNCAELRNWWRSFSSTTPPMLQNPRQGISTYLCSRNSLKATKHFELWSIKATPFSY